MMSWRFISSKVFLSLLLVACIGLQQIMSAHSTDWKALENPAFMDLPLTQAEMNEQSVTWVKSLENELRKSWDAKIGGESVDDWLISQKKEVELELAGTEDGSIYPLEFHMRVGERILQKLRKYKNG